MAERFQMSYPAYTLIFREARKAFMLTANGEYLVPLFTDLDNAKSYLERSAAGFLEVVPLNSAVEISDYMKELLMRVIGKPPSYVAIDPLRHDAKFDVTFARIGEFIF